MHGGTIAALQQDGAGCVLPPHCGAKGGGCGGICTARKLATLVYGLLRWGQPYLDEGALAHEKRYREGLKRLTCRRQASWLPAYATANHGLRLVIGAGEVTDRKQED